MDLHEEFESYARVGAPESGARLRGADVRARLDARVVRGRRVRNAKVGAGTVAAVGAFAFGAVMVPRLDWGVSSPVGSPSLSGDLSISAAPGDDQVSSPSPSPSPSPSLSRPALSDPLGGPAVTVLHALGQEGYLSSVDRIWQLTGPATCEGIAAEPYGGADGGQPGEDSTLPVPVPSWIEDGRLYGWGDDVLVGGYPIPVASASDDHVVVGGDASVEQFGRDAMLVVTDRHEVSWGYTLTWSFIGDPEHDAPGTFVSMSDTYACNGDGVPAAGMYNARIGYLAADGTYEVIELAPIEVVDGVPSLPEVNAQG